MERPERTILDALHAELLGNLVDLTSQLDRIQIQVPTLASDVAAITAGVSASIEHFKTSTIALVGYIKHKQQETLGSLQASQAAVTSEAKKTLSGFEKWLWLIAGLLGVNILLLIVVIFKV